MNPLDAARAAAVEAQEMLSNALKGFSARTSNFMTTAPLPVGAEGDQIAILLYGCDLVMGHAGFDDDGTPRWGGHSHKWLRPGDTGHAWIWVCRDGATAETAAEVQR